ncbi:MAG: proteasome accessory factor PafA2 family protein [Verrucomicrobia bacterium]|nr:proteasome accessory factor PafA2 family protein [Verrucomicrobiota bacterium]
MSERLLGLETEYALRVLDGNGRRIEPGQSALWLMESAQRCWPHLPAACAGLFLPNGARFYVDCGVHPEMTTPECPNPWDVARYMRAGERLLLMLADDMARRLAPVRDVGFFRHNVDYSGSCTTWGSHESYLHTASPERFAPELIPHLVSRILYTGAGGFDTLYPGIRFLLSPRVPHLQAEVSADSTHTRGILHTKDESLSSHGFHRLHLICSESLGSDLALFLRMGATAVLVAMVEADLQPARGLRLSRPLRAMQTFAADPACQAVVESPSHGMITALHIQRHYLHRAEQSMDHPLLPPWTREVCRHWRATLDAIESNGPDAVATRLDWAIKYNIFTHFIRQRGFSWDAIARWNRVLENLELTRCGVTPTANTPAAPPPRPPSAGRPPLCRSPLPPDASPVVAQLVDQLGLTGQSLSEFPRLRAELFELDIRFGQLGDHGLLTSLDRAGVLHHHFPGVDNIKHAMEYPPAIGRAGLRGSCVRRFGRTSAEHGAPRHLMCDWTMICDYAAQRMLDLSHPFAREEEWHPLNRRPPLMADFHAHILNRLRAARL